MHILLVDDSDVSRMLLRAILEEAGFSVTEADSGVAALAALDTLQPDLITMDVHMPGLNGFEATRQIMRKRPVPIVIVTAGVDMPGAQTAMLALEAGALMVLDKPTGPTDPDFDTKAEHIVQVIARLAPTRVRAPVDESDAGMHTVLNGWHRRPIRAVAIGASAGGPPALKLLLPLFAADFPWPILLVQHISQGFVSSYCDWLSSQTCLPVEMAVDGTPALPGHIYVAPDDDHLKLDAQLRIRVDHGLPEQFIRPSIDVLFDSMASSLRGDVIAILLSGMGRDGVAGMSRLKALGALTMVQKPTSAMVEGIPLAAVESGAACIVQTPRGMAETINHFIRERGASMAGAADKHA